MEPTADAASPPKKEPLERRAATKSEYLDGDDGRWILAEVADLDATLDLPEIGCTLVLADVYERVVP